MKSRKKSSYLETNENEHTTKYMGHREKTVLKKKFIPLQPYFKKQEKSQINNITRTSKRTANKAQSK